MDMQEIGAAIRAARKAAGLSQAQLAKRRKMSRATISLIESGNVSEIGIRKIEGILREVGLALHVVPRQRPVLQDLQDQNARAQAEALKESSEALRPGRP